MKRIKVKATAKMYITPTEDSLRIMVPDGFVLIIKGKNSKSDVHKILLMQGRINAENITNEYLLSVLHRVLSWLSIFLDVPISEIALDSTDIFDEDNSKGTTVSTRSVKVRGAIATPISTIENFNKFLKIMDSKYSYPIEVDLYFRARAENNVIAKFWNLYNVLQIVTGKERSGIDTELQKYKDIKTVESDYNKQSITVITAIRDAFSHNGFTHDNGTKLELLSEIRKVNPKLQNICRDMIRTKYKA